MPAELEVLNGAASFAYNANNGEPWHKMGTAINGYGTIDEMLEACNGDYIITTKPVYVQGENGEMVEVPERRATTRINPVTGELEAFEVVKTRYVPFNNREIMENALEIVGAAKGDAVLDTAGVLFEGRRFFFTLDLGTLVIDPMGSADEIKRYLVGYTSHDATVATTYANTSIRAVCENTCQMGMREAKNVFRAKHTANQDKRVEEARQVLGISVDWSREFLNKANEMLAVDMTAKRFDEIIDAVWPEAEADTDRKADNRDEIVGVVKHLYASPKNAGGVGNNGWAAYNTVVEYVDHYRVNVDPTTRAIQAMDPVSTATQMKKTAADRVLSFV